jgi:hypothetical protein
VRTLVFSSLAVLLILTAWASTARAEPVRPAPWAIEVAAGSLSGDRHLVSGVGEPIAFYATVSVARDVAPMLAVETSAGLSFEQGLVFGATAQVFADVGWFRFSLGAGPLVAPSAAFGFGAFAQGDLAAEFRFDRVLIVSAGYSLAFGLRRAGSHACGTDTCDAWTQPGDRIEMLHAGFGVMF